MKKERTIYSINNNQNLTGLCVLNTRPIGEQDSIAEAIVAANGQNLPFPTLEITPNPDSWLVHLPNLSAVSAAIFISPNAVHYAFSRLNRANVEWPATLTIYAIGQGTLRALERYQLNAVTPSHADSEHLLQLSSLQNVSNQTILLFKGAGGRELIEHSLKARGAKVHLVEVYQRKLPQHFNLDPLNHWLEESQIDIILYTSEQGMLNLFNYSTKQVYTQLKKTPCLVISQRLAEVALRCGYTQIIVSSVDSILETLYQFKQGKTHGGC